jgi:hypothetical protein
MLQCHVAFVWTAYFHIACTDRTPMIPVDGNKVLLVQCTNNLSHRVSRIEHFVNSNERFALGSGAIALNC